jgi:hypothetical protein
MSLKLSLFFSLQDLWRRGFMQSIELWGEVLHEMMVSIPVLVLKCAMTDMF